VKDESPAAEPVAVAENSEQTTAESN
jgi:hypothetical protein